MLKAGEFITCTNGHLVCEVVEDIAPATRNWATHLGRFRGREPVIGGPKPFCECGAEWVCAQVFHVAGPFSHATNHLHVEGRGWVPPLAIQPT